MKWNSDEELYDLILSRLYTPVVGDILDSAGYFHQFLTPEIGAMKTEMRVCGRAMPVLMMDVFGPQSEPFGLMTQALDDLAPGEVYVASGAAFRSATWGEIMTATAKTRRAAGAVLNGYHRDTPQVLAQSFPVFSRGRWAQDSGPRMKVADFRCTIEIGSVAVRPGDLVFGDQDGVIVIPANMEEEVIRKALEKAATEKTVRKAIEAGMTATDAFRRYGVL
ncbi:RraA family protein [Salinispira pacifica]